MSVALGVAKSNAHRILATLTAMGFARHAENGRYEATLKAWEIGSAVLSRYDIREVARPFMLALSSKCGETAHLSILEGFDVVYIDKIEGAHPVRAYSRIGGRAPSYAVATGKTLLAFKINDKAHLPAKLEAFTSHTIKTQAALCRELEKVRKTGYAVNLGEWREGVGGVAAPIKNDWGETIAAIGVSCPTSRLGAERLRTLRGLVIASAGEVSKECGYREHKRGHAVQR